MSCVVGGGAGDFGAWMYLLRVVADFWGGRSFGGWWLAAIVCAWWRAVPSRSLSRRGFA